MRKEPDIIEYPLHIQILRQDLSRRMGTNSSYSMRSYAKQLSIDPSLLSKILNNQRTLSVKTAKKIIDLIKIDENEKRLFWQSLFKSKENQLQTELSNEKIDLSTSKVSFLDKEAFKLIAEPHHYAIVELTQLKSFKNDLVWLSSKLGISKSEVKLAIKRLKDVGMLEEVDGKLLRTQLRFTTKDKTKTDQAHKLHQKKILKMAINALDIHPIDKRAQSSMTIAINSEKVSMAKILIENFINELCDLLETPSTDQVYQMSFSLFPFFTEESREIK